MTEKHFVEVENEEKVAVVHHKTDSDKWIFFCHGFGSDKEGSYEKRAEELVKEGWNAVRFDFRGNGESDGEFIEQSLSSKINDLKTLIKYFRPGKYVLFGSSFGGKVIFHSSQDLNPEAVIGRAPVTYNNIMDKYRSVIQNKGKYTHHPGATIDERFMDDYDTYSFDTVIQTLKVPVAIFHGADDTTVHPKHSFQAAEALDTDVMLQKIKGEKHSFTEEAENYMIDQISSWLQENIS